MFGVNKDDPEFQKKIERAKEVSDSLDRLGAAMEVAKPGAGSLLMMSALVTGCTMLPDKEFAEWKKTINLITDTTVQMVKKKLDGIQNGRPTADDLLDPTQLLKDADKDESSKPN
jgi:hypothetical protein